MPLHWDRAGCCNVSHGKLGHAISAWALWGSLLTQRLLRAAPPAVGPAEGDARRGAAAGGGGRRGAGHRAHQRAPVHRGGAPPLIWSISLLRGVYLHAACPSPSRRRAPAVMCRGALTLFARVMVVGVAAPGGGAGCCCARAACALTRPGSVLQPRHMGWRKAAGQGCCCHADGLRCWAVSCGQAAHTRAALVCCVAHSAAVAAGGVGAGEGGRASQASAWAAGGGAPHRRPGTILRTVVVLQPSCSCCCLTQKLIPWVRSFVVS